MLQRFSLRQNSVIIDADGCPVVNSAANIAKEHAVQCIVVSDSAHCFNVEGAKCVTVSQGSDSADFYIVNHIKVNDIVVTQDYGLAAMCLAKNAVVINQDGKIYSDNNIDGLLAMRAVNRELRRSGKHTKGPPKRRKEQNLMFEETLRGILKNAEV